MLLIVVLWLNWFGAGEVASRRELASTRQRGTGGSRVSVTPEGKKRNTCDKMLE